uniref:Insulinase family protein n=1 Tax=candidate division WOR-3 bacterium TaxID=2052148 RepID=A0A7C4GI71_UNCW3
MAADSGDNCIKTTALSGGLVVLSERLAHIRSVALGIDFRLGSRDDPAGKSGTAHLIEHMVFKGTRDLDARAINIAAETHGAELNAFTDREATCFYGRFPGDRRRPVAALLAEIVSAPEFAPTELEKEKQVVADEIRTADEDPDSAAVNLLLQAVFGDSPLGKPVAGTLDSVAGISPADLRSFYDSFYGSGCCVATAVGDVDHDELVELAATSLDRPGRAAASRTPAAFAPRRALVEVRPELSQVYVCLARPAFAYGDQRRYALSVLNTALGGGVSSRLFQRLREDEALVYSVSSFTELFADTGLLGIYFVTDGRKLGRCLAVLSEELSRLLREKIAAEEFERALNMTRSSVLLSLESPTNRMMRLARTWLMLGRVIGVDETLAGFDRLTRSAVSDLVEELLAPDGFYVGAVGPGGADVLTDFAAGRS